jgi:hypothetical protein
MKIKKCKYCGTDSTETRFYDSDTNRCLSCKSLYIKTPQQKERRRQLAKIDYQKNKHQNMARSKVKRAIHNGILVRQCCEFCGDENTQAHHDDYSRPLDVRWLCPQHHHMVHVEKRKEER